MKLKDIMKRKSITQLELALALGISQQLVSKWINHKCTPEPSFIKRIAIELNVSVETILNCFE